MRAPPDVHAALRQNDPKMASYSQPVVKKAPPTLGRPRPSAFYSDAEPSKDWCTSAPSTTCSFDNQLSLKDRIFYWQLHR